MVYAVINIWCAVFKTNFVSGSIERAKTSKSKPVNKEKRRENRRIKRIRRKEANKVVCFSKVFLKMLT